MARPTPTGCSAQYKARRAYQGDYERAERGARAIDPSKEVVDGGLAVDPLPISQMTARNKLIEIERILEHYLVRILQAVLVHGAELRSLAASQSREDKAQIGRMFRMGLELLAVQYGFSQRDYHRKRKIEQPGMA